MMLRRGVMSIGVGPTGASELDNKGSHCHFDIQLRYVDERVKQDEDFCIGKRHKTDEKHLDAQGRVNQTVLRLSTGR